MREQQIVTELIAAEIVFCAWMFLLIRWWFYHLVALAEHHDLPARRRLAALRYVLLLPFCGLPMVGFVCGFCLHINVGSRIVAIGFFLAVVSPFIWFSRRIKILKSLGYGKR